MMSAFITVLNVPLYYVEAGTGPVILYIHGNTGSSFWYSKVMDIPGYRTIALDMPNFGRSGRIDESAAPGASDLDLYADHVAGFIRAIGTEKNHRRRALAGRWRRDLARGEVSGAHAGHGPRRFRLALGA